MCFLGDHWFFLRYITYSVLPRNKFSTKPLNFPNGLIWPTRWLETTVSLLILLNPSAWDTFKINVESLRTFRGPLFCYKLVDMQVLLWMLGTTTLIWFIQYVTVHCCHGDCNAKDKKYVGIFRWSSLFLFVSVFIIVGG